ncbi:MAG: carboxymuconolactone decarboxylase family protein [Acidimicrobiales bacterium]|nr:carboxymuconolactone decarboxylase family protein [Acidimicrobiales bacterium]
MADETARDRGKEMMRAVYGWDIEPDKPFEVATVDHLFGEVWAEGELTVKERRLLLLGLTVGTGQIDVAGLQADAAMKLGEFTAEELRSMTVFLAHYAGWPRAAAFNSQVEQIIARNDKTEG